MNKEDIRIKNVIVHIMDSTIGMPVLSDKELEYGSEIAEFLKEHIAKISSGDDAKECRFYREESEIFHILEEYADENFVPISKDIATMLYEIMNSNIDIPPADLMVVRFREGEDEYLALLKMNYKTQYTHRTMTLEDGEGNSNEIIRHKSLLPSESQRLTYRGGDHQAGRSLFAGHREKVRGEWGKDQLFFLPVPEMQRAYVAQIEAVDREQGGGECAEGRL